MTCDICGDASTPVVLVNINSPKEEPDMAYACTGCRTHMHTQEPNDWDDQHSSVSLDELISALVAENLAARCKA